jgi:hypothetical protein
MLTLLWIVVLLLSVGAIVWGAEGFAKQPEKAGVSDSIPFRPPFIINNLQDLNPKPPRCGGFYIFGKHPIFNELRP